ncbi:MAG: hypothetical protein RID07_18060, partial [Lacipirellulaceae bacterium]
PTNKTNCTNQAVIKHRYAHSIRVIREIRGQIRSLSFPKDAEYNRRLRKLRGRTGFDRICEA